MSVADRCRSPLLAQYCPGFVVGGLEHFQARARPPTNSDLPAIKFISRYEVHVHRPMRRIWRSRMIGFVSVVVQVGQP